MKKCLYLAVLYSQSFVTNGKASTDEKGYYSNKISLEDLNKNIEDKKNKRFTSIKPLAFIVKRSLLLSYLCERFKC